VQPEYGPGYDGLVEPHPATPFGRSGQVEAEPRRVVIDVGQIAAAGEQVEIRIVDEGVRRIAKATIVSLAGQASRPRSVTPKPQCITWAASAASTKPPSESPEQVLSSASNPMLRRPIRKDEELGGSCAPFPFPAAVCGQALRTSQDFEMSWCSVEHPENVRDQEEG
jgi:hypothetical protein